MISGEPGLPYQRPPLSKSFLLGKATAESLAFRPEAWYVEQRIELVYGQATSIDRASRTVSLADGRRFGYHHLVLATGARNRVPPVGGMEQHTVLGLRTLSDAQALKGKLATLRRLVVVGAGFIGLEVAVAARAGGAEVDVLELGGRPMQRALSAMAAERLEHAHAATGVHLHCGHGLASVQFRDGSFRLGSHAGLSLDADVWVLGAGVTPNSELASDCGLAVDNGVAVNELLVSNDPDISAIGDCASFPSVHTGQRQRLESVQNATDQAKCVAARLLGHPAPYTALPWFWSDQGTQRLQMAGLLVGGEEFVGADGGATGQFSVLCFRHGRLVAAESLNNPVEHMAVKRILAGERRPTLAEARTPGFDLRAWEKAASAT
jgi:3-phenylpropionate/trans-cinnamate dioxygenase ferredoxin reductase subunit